MQRMHRNVSDGRLCGLLWIAPPTIDRELRFDVSADRELKDWMEMEESGRSVQQRISHCVPESLTFL